MLNCIILTSLQLDDDVPYEEEILRNPYVVKSWVRYLEFKEAAPFYVRNVIYERALKELPGSYKLWAAYLRERVQQVRAFPLNDPAYDAVNNAFDRCLVLLHKVEILANSNLLYRCQGFG